MKRIINEQPISRTGNSITFVMNKDKTAKAVIVNANTRLLTELFKSFDPLNK